MKNLSLTYQKSGRSIGFVPTMGALHEGHLSLLNIAAQQADVTVMSIFVNPVQFGPAEDYSKYPRPFEDDSRKAEEAGCDVLFAPAKEQMYPDGFSTFVSVENITETLCGASRPGHFRGVATVVLKLLNIVQPQVAVFGQKDAQQAVVIKRMVRDLDLPVSIIAAPTIREQDGLAMSSRNAYLTPAERNDAPLIYGSLQLAERLYACGQRNAAALYQTISENLARSNLLKPEYIEIVDVSTLRPVNVLSSTALIAVACRTQESNTRLIDNITLGGSL